MGWKFCEYGWKWKRNWMGTGGDGNEILLMGIGAILTPVHNSNRRGLND